MSKYGVDENRSVSTNTTMNGFHINDGKKS